MGARGAWLKKRMRKQREQWKEDGKASKNKAHQTVILFYTRKSRTADE